MIDHAALHSSFIDLFTKEAQKLGIKRGTELYNDAFITADLFVYANSIEQIDNWVVLADHIRAKSKSCLELCLKPSPKSSKE